MKNRWNDKDAEAAIKTYNDVSEDLALRVYTSRLIGADPALVIHGGGNTSVKSTAKTRVGEEVPVLYVKGSGWDLDTLQPPGLPGVKLDPLLKLRQLDRLSDEDMVNEQRINLLDASSPNPSVETLLHAFLPHKFIDHSHADASLVIANQPNAEAMCREIFGDTFGLVSYIMPGFLLAKAAAEAYEKNPDVKGLVLINHGLFTFGETAKESYDRHIEAVTLAEKFIAGKKQKTLSPINGSKSSLRKEELLVKIAPVLRGLYAEKTGVAWTVHHREDAFAYEFAGSAECSTWSQIGTATPDHVIRTKQKPLLLNLINLDDADALWEEVSRALEQYSENYHDYFRTNSQAKGVEKKELDPLPRVILLNGVGLITIGKTTKETGIAADIYQHTLGIIHQAFSIGEYQPIQDDDLFDMEYWSLEQAKLGKSQPKKLEGKIVAVSGAASGIGLATARLFAEHGANLFLIDRDDGKLTAAKDALQKDLKASVVTCALDVTDGNAIRGAFGHLVREFGGLDILISNAGNAVQGRIGDVDPAALRASFDLNFFAHQALASQAVKLFLEQRTGGVLLFNASKAAFNPGKNFGPYALPKAAVVALTKQYALDYGKEGVRANAVNADRVRTGLFTGDVIKERAAARGLTADDYFKNNLLEKEVYDTDVAQGFLDLALAEKTTGSVITIDGGNIAASPR
ncbi:MAG: bifunctional aldolase/short-chain dehydrogenase [Nitrospinae bacterium]|nr:bifunctional aldolase/short-chain dehydrogenase [Nitrospinota bacterium]MDA1108844.1 bifunctional aldolase/short-chain dehydrogenase [Nitrospinota bacterium]